jgi:hypothetical protein
MEGDDSVYSVLAVVIIFVIVPVITIVVSVRSSVRRMLRSAEPQESPADAESLFSSVRREFKVLLDAEGFRFTKAYSFGATKFGIWMQIHPLVPTRTFCLLRAPGRRLYSFETAFSDEATLTTSMSRTAFLFPRAFGDFLQCFPNASPIELWSAHLRAEQYIISKLEVPVRECRLPFLEGFRHQIRRSLTYATSLRWWYLRAVYWYLLKRFLLQNRPVWQQDVAAMYGRRIS